MIDTGSLAMFDQYLRESERWLRALRRGENVSVLFFPKTDRLRRLPQLLSDRKRLEMLLGKESRFLFQTIEFNKNVIDDQSDLEEHIARNLNFSHISPRDMTIREWLRYLQDEHIRLVLVLPEAEKLLSAETSAVFQILSSFITSAMPQVTLLAFFEVDIFDEENKGYLPSSTHLFENVLYYPLYDALDSDHFITYLEKKWEIHVNHTEKERMVKRLGGHLLFIKEAMREIVDTGTWSEESDGMLMRFRSLSEFLRQYKKEIQALKKVKSTFTRSMQERIEYLKKLRVIDENNMCLIPALCEYMLEHEDSETEIEMQERTIVVNNIPLDRLLSRKEYRVMKVLLERKGQIVSRDTIASRIWPTDTEKQYSDWAIDQIVKRLRGKMKELLLPPKALRVARGKGYLLELP